MNWEPDKPFNNLPLLPPTVEIESKKVLKQCITARAALAQLKQAAALIPNDSMLINTIPLLEARDSSLIENIVTTSDQLFQYSDRENKADPAIKEALRYRTALHTGWKALPGRPLSTRTAELICSEIKNSEMTVRRVPGTKLANQQTGETIYTPPEGEALLRDLLSNWENMLYNNPDIDPLIRMAVSHYQFEAIHPFTDGNGRTGRILNILYLVQEDLIGLPILYLSRYINDHKDDYYNKLLAVTGNNAWEPWILYMLEAVESTSHWTNQKIHAIRDLSDVTADYVKAQLPKIYSRELIDIIFMQPYCRIQNLVDADIAQRQTASEYLKQLGEIGVLIEQKHGRERLFIHPKLIGILSEDSNEIQNY